MSRRGVVGPVLCAALLASCGAVSVASPTPRPSPTPVHWSYEGDAGPEHWGELSGDFVLCATGESQSPIDIAEVDERDLANVTFDYQPAPLEILNNGHTVQVNYSPGSSIELDGVRYELLQFHFHAPSEHTIGGTPADAELHLVHRNEDKELAVVGVLLEEGAANPGFDPVFEHLPTEAGPATKVPETRVDAAALLPETQTTRRYSGSLTTPPCSEGVSWLLMTEPVEVGADQLAAFTAIIEDNNRPVQPLNDREVLEDTTP